MKLIFATLLALYITACNGQRIITGSIMDSSGEALIGASILIKNTNLGTVSDTIGNFQLSIPESMSTLIVRYTGFIPTEINLTDQAYYVIIIKEDCVKCWFDSQEIELGLDYGFSNKQVGLKYLFTTPALFKNAILRFEGLQSVNNRNTKFNLLKSSVLHLFSNCGFDLDYNFDMKNILTSEQEVRIFRNYVDLNFNKFYPTLGMSIKRLKFQDVGNVNYGIVIGYRYSLGRPLYIKANLRSSFYQNDIELELIFTRRINREFQINLSGYRIREVNMIRIGIDYGLNYFLPKQRHKFNHM